MGSQLQLGAIGARFLNVAAQATTVVKASAGILHRIVVNKAVANGTLTIYDNASAASGTKLATVTCPGTLLQNHFVLEFGCAVANGIVIVGGAADVDYTAVYS
jgi:hypothetical protein